MIKAEIIPTGERVNVRHLRKYARTKSMAAVMVGNATLGPKVVGNLTGEYETNITWDEIEIPESIKSRFRAARYDGEQWSDKQTKKPVSQAKAVVLLGNDFYYLP